MTKHAEDNIPRPESYYKTLPAFDRTLVFYDNDGRVLRHIIDPLDETYSTEPTDYYVKGSIPPEEMEVRDVLLASTFYRARISTWEFWKSLLFKPTESYLVTRDIQRRLNNLPRKSPEHRAAFCRLANGEALNPGLRTELRRIIERADKRTGLQNEDNNT